MRSGVNSIREHEGKLTGADSEDEASVPETNIQDLPDECLIRILRCLGPVNFWREELEEGIDADAIRNPLHCALISKRWRALADLGVNSLCLSKRVDIPHLLKAFARWRFLKRLDLGPDHSVFQSSYDVKTVLQSASSMLPFLQNLCFSYSFDNLPDICTLAYSMPHLTTLELKCCELPPMNDRSSEILHALELFYFRGTELQSSLALFTGLRRLSIDEAYSHESLPTSVTQLSLLTSLNLNMMYLRELPDSIGHLTGLTYLRVRSKCIQRWPQSLWDLPALTTLIVSQMNSPSPLPLNLHHLTRLKELRITRIQGFEGLPEDVCDLPHLVELELSDGGSSLSELPSSLGSASSLQILRIKCCDSLIRVPANIGAITSLRELELSYCSLLTSLPSLGYLSRLRSLSIKECHSLGEWTGTLRGLTALEVLVLENCSSLVSLPEGMGALGKLHILEILNCGLRELPPHLGPQTLKISFCSSLVSLPQSLGSRHLYILACPSLQQFSEGFGQQAPALEKLVLQGVDWVSMPSSLGSFKSLKSLVITDYRYLVGLPESLGELKALEKLKLMRCPLLASLPENLGLLCNLTKLVLDRCPVRELPESVGQLTSLETLRFTSLPLVSLPESLGALTNLRELVLFQGDHTTRVPDNIRNLGGGTVFRLKYTMSRIYS